MPPSGKTSTPPLEFPLQVESVFKEQVRSPGNFINKCIHAKEEDVKSNLLI
jgi:hypothetical protein